MDAINELCTVSGFEFFVDEDGKARFYFPTDRQPSITNEEIYLLTQVIQTLRTTTWFRVLML
jgi:hypothetical protein